MTAAGAARAKRGVILLLVCGGGALGVMDYFIVNVALPTIQKSLHTDFSGVQLVMAMYGLAYAVALVPGGQAGDRFGHRRVYLAGLIGFIAASFACGLATSATALVVARIAQGLAAAFLVPQCMAILYSTFSGRDCDRALRVYGASLGLASILGQVLGGTLVATPLLGWRAIFFVNLPLGAALLALAHRLPDDAPRSSRARLDPTAIVLLAGGLFLLEFPLMRGRAAGWPAWALWSLVASFPVLAIFLAEQRRRSRDGEAVLLEWFLFRERSFSLGLLAALLFYAGQGAAFLVVALMLQQRVGLDPAHAGLVFGGFGVGFTASNLASKALSRVRGLPAVLGGLLLMATALFLLSLAVPVPGVQAKLGRMAALLAIYGFGQGLAYPALLGVTLSSVPSRTAGAASGTLFTTHQIALATGVALVGFFYPRSLDASIMFCVTLFGAVALVLPQIPRKAWTNA